jgi:hypothetical protein
LEVVAVELAMVDLEALVALHLPFQLQQTVVALVEAHKIKPVVKEDLAAEAVEPLVVQAVKVIHLLNLHPLLLHKVMMVVTQAMQELVVAELVVPVVALVDKVVTEVVAVLHP